MTEKGNFIVRRIREARARREEQILGLFESLEGKGVTETGGIELLKEEKRLSKENHSPRGFSFVALLPTLSRLERSGQIASRLETEKIIRVYHGKPLHRKLYHRVREAT